MEEKNLVDMTLSELRLLYPSIKATSKKVFLEKVEEQVIINNIVPEPDSSLLIVEDKDGNVEAIPLDEDTSAPDINYNGDGGAPALIDVESDFGNELVARELVPYLTSVARTNKKIIIKTPSTFDADFMFLHLKEKLLPELQKQGVMIMASSTRRDFHFNGTCYCRLVCQANYNHISGLIKYDTFKEFVNE